MQILKVENLSKSYSEKQLFNKISFSIGEGERSGLIGVNGTGKSTLLKILADLDTPDTGFISHPKEYRIEYLSQDPDLNSQLTVLEQVFYGDSPLMKLFREYEEVLSSLQTAPNNQQLQKALSALQLKMDLTNAWEANSLAKTILSRLGISQFNQKISELSGGLKKRVAIASALIQPADLLILDEPTNHLDNDTIEWLEEYLSKYHKSLLLVTHDRYFLTRVTNRILELDNGNLYSYDGNYEYFLEKKAEREELALASDNKRKNILRRELAWLQRGAKARSTKQKARIERIENLQTETSTTNYKIDFMLGASRLGKKVIVITNISKAYDSKTLIKDFSWIINPGEKIGIVGPNGSGKTTLLNIIANHLSTDNGIVEIGETVRIAYYNQENVEINGEMRVIDYIKEEANYIEEADQKKVSAEQMLEKFLFPPAVQWNKISKLSGGEKRRLRLLRILMKWPNVLLLDEPTNDLDILTLSILEDYIESFQGVVIIVSHDRYFLDRTTEYLLTFEDGGRISRFNGNYSEYLQLKNSEKQLAKPPERIQNEQNTKNNLKQKLSYNEQREWDNLEETIASLEQELQTIQNEITEAGSNFEKVASLYNAEKELNNKLEAHLERWAELSELIEQIELNKSN